MEIVKKDSKRGQYLLSHCQEVPNEDGSPYFVVNESHLVGEGDYGDYKYAHCVWVDEKIRKRKAPQDWYHDDSTYYDENGEITYQNRTCMYTSADADKKILEEKKIALEQRKIALEKRRRIIEERKAYGCATRLLTMKDNKLREFFLEEKSGLEKSPNPCKSLAEMCHAYVFAKDKKIKKEMLSDLYTLRKSGTNEDKRNMARLFKDVLEYSPKLKSDENLQALAKIDNIFVHPTNTVKKQIEK